MTAQEFLAIYPKFTCVGDPFITQALKEADCLVAKCAYSDEQRELAIQYLVAHEATLEMRGGFTEGVVSSQKVGDLSKSYAVGNADDPDAYYQITLYGKKFLQLRSTLVVSPLVID